jgi:hypothetical protein
VERHELLTALHARLHPRNYLEIGIDTGVSLALSKVPSIGIDPAFAVVSELDGDVQLVRATSDDYFRRNDPTERFGGDPLDLAFIDGMHSRSSPSGTSSTWRRTPRGPAWWSSTTCCPAAWSRQRGTGRPFPGPETCSR